MASWLSVSAWLCFFLLLFRYTQSSSNVEEGTLYVDGSAAIAKIDDDFICATIDLWPSTKCDYGNCSWGNSSFLNLDLSNEVLLNAIRALSPMKIRLGGTLQDKLIYQTEHDNQPCIPFQSNTSWWELFGFNRGCLPLSRWDELNHFFNKTGARIYFGLNALNGRTRLWYGVTLGDWDWRNAESFIRYTVSKGYTIHGWEFGNELNGYGVDTKISADQYASDVITLHKLVQDIYKGKDATPLILAPGALFDADWYSEFIDKSSDSVQVVTLHIYTIGAGNDPFVLLKMLDIKHLDEASKTFSGLRDIVQKSGTSAVVWISESGGVWGSGQNLVSNSFVSIFWYLDQLGMASTFNFKSFCRQTLVGGYYGLLDTETFHPNPDYYGALLWHRLMGRSVLSTHFQGTNRIRAYTHCSKSSDGITVMLMNLNGSATVKISLSVAPLLLLRINDDQIRGHGTWREEYHLTAKDGDLHSRTVLLNGKELRLDRFGRIPPLEPIRVKDSDTITIAPFSIVFVHNPSIQVPACSMVTRE